MGCDEAIELAAPERHIRETPGFRHAEGQGFDDGQQPIECNFLVIIGNAVQRLSHAQCRRHDRARLVLLDAIPEQIAFAGNEIDEDIGIEQEARCGHRRSSFPSQSSSRGAMSSRSTGLIPGHEP